jgi:hypothetical protein
VVGSGAFSSHNTGAFSGSRLQGKEDLGCERKINPGNRSSQVKCVVETPPGVTKTTRRKV